MKNRDDILYKLEMLRSLNISMGDYSTWTDEYNFKNYQDRIDGLCLVSNDIIDEIRKMVE
ncbi:hypothetical protein PEPE_0529 [Pediococcus pentosaceus ATCC 25745]|uniref:Uncharacterized protein n=1 Tax=Pediococcus pentosaceus (strain ATCC 25745 / CCUG 21536 / LMG 10740 / 183-1w) TaxID=278197 RepID=Q03GQ3_PEDPA|nr:hypothetical protein [Pediococcus pentosaceus]ABJ67619.1 hypothetical protein PEPE_0529 [Pediococcus pentosaceus ATCC 25745]QYY85478.1 hypothetical protein GRI00_02445 [Pediococcus pentosaceus]